MKSHRLPFGLNSFFISALLLLPCALASSGCQSLFQTPDPWGLSWLNPFAAPEDGTPEKGRHGLEQPGLRDNQLRQTLSANAWRFDPLEMGRRRDGREASTRRFVGRMTGLNEESAIDSAALLNELNHDDPRIAASAAILLAQRGDDRGRQQLHETVQSDLPLSLRCAAVEALGALGRDREVLFQELLAARTAPADTYQPHWHAALIIGLANNVHPSVDPQFAAHLYAAPAEGEALLPPGAACVSPSPHVKAASLLAWRGRVQPLPPEARALRFDSHSGIRALYCRVAAESDAASELEFAEDALRDADLNVRYSAILLLGSMPAGSVEASAAVEMLDGILAEPGDLVPAAAVEALANLGAWEQVIAAAAHKSWRVRQAVARQFDRPRAPHDDQIMKSLLTDSNIAVQEAAVDALRAWPIVRSAPLLVLAMERSAHVARVNAESVLVHKWPQARIILPKGSTKNRAAALAKLREHWTAAVEEQKDELEDAAAESADRIVASALNSGAGALTPASLELRNAMTVLLSPSTSPQERDDAMSIVRHHGEQFASGVDEVIADAQAQAALATLLPDVAAATALPEQLYLEVLPQHDPVFAFLRDFAQSDDATARQQALLKLVEPARGGELSGAAVDRLVELLLREQDPVLWRAGFNLVTDWDRPSVRRLARLAIANADAEVSRRACECFAAWGDAESASMLTDYLDHPSSVVALAAAEGLGRCGELPDASRLENLLIVPDRRVRLAAARSLVAHHLQTGGDALRRLAHDVDPQTARSAATAMGESLRMEFVPPLIELLDEAPSLSRVAQISLEQITSAYGIAPTFEATSVRDKTIAWKTWHAEHGAELAALPPVASQGWEASGDSHRSSAFADNLLNPANSSEQRQPEKPGALDGEPPAANRAIPPANAEPPLPTALPDYD